MTIAERLDADLKEALRARDAIRTSTIRLARAAVQNAEIDRRRPLTDDEVMVVLRHEVKRRREAIEGFERGRDDLVQKEKLEMAILLGYLPAPFGEQEIRQLVAEVVSGLDAGSERDFGQVMGQVMRRIAGRAEGKTVERIVREVLRR